MKYNIAFAVVAIFLIPLGLIQAEQLSQANADEPPVKLVPEEPASGELIQIGVLSYRGKQAALQRWEPTAEYLTKSIPGYKFQFLPLDLDEMAEAVKHDGVQFILTSPGHYVEMESQFGISRIATMESYRDGEISTRFGAVIFTRADNQAIKSLEDLKGKSFMAVSENAFGGFQMAWREMAERGINPFKDFSRLEFVGFPQDQVAMAVYDRKVDAATVRSETLHRMIEAGHFKLEDFRILNPQKVEGYSAPLSTRLYPEWPIAKSKTTSRELASKVILALLSMPTEHPAASMARIAGWTVPLDYSQVHELMKDLKIGPYYVLHETTLTGIMKKYAYWLLGIAILLVLLVILNAYISRTNRRLRETDRLLREEIAERKQSQAKLAEYKDTLEERVIARTDELEKANKSLQNSRIALHKLVDITSAPGLSHDQKLTRLLETGREYYQVAVASLSSLDGGDRKTCTSVGHDELVTGNSGALLKDCAHRLIQQNISPLDIPDVISDVGNQLNCGAETIKSYLATAVYVKGQPHCILEFAHTETRSEPYSHWDHNILEVMGQWIGSELEKQTAIEEKQRHQSELARVARLSAMGEMAAGLAHELNQPLTGAINYSSGCLRRMKQGDFDKDKMIQGLERTVEGATLAADIIRHLREFVQKGEPERELSALNSVVMNIVDLVSAEINRHAVKVVFDLCDNLPNIVVNVVQMEQVVLNFIINAIDAMEQVDSTKRVLTIKTESNHGKIRLSVIDSGDGISAEDEPKLFDAFYTTKSEGMGVGLSISRSIIEAHQGSISARNVENGGACFSFELPLNNGC